MILDVATSSGKYRHVKAATAKMMDKGYNNRAIGVALESRDAGHEVPVQLLASGGIAEIAWGGTDALNLGVKVFLGTEGHLGTGLTQALGGSDDATAATPTVPPALRTGSTGSNTTTPDPMENVQIVGYTLDTAPANKKGHTVAVKLCEECF